MLAAFGLGGLVAATASIAATGSARLVTPFGTVIALWGVPLLVMWLLMSSHVSVGAFLVVEVANRTR